MMGVAPIFTPNPEKPDTHLYMQFGQPKHAYILTIPCLATEVPACTLTYREKMGLQIVLCKPGFAKSSSPMITITVPEAVQGCSLCRQKGELHDTGNSRTT